MGADTEPLASALMTVGAFHDLSEQDLGELAAKLDTVAIARGEMLVRQGDRAEALYLVVSGRFDVFVEGRADALAEVGSGDTIGEIAFFSGGTRTASVRAARDSLVLKLERQVFEQLALRSPAIWRTITATLARRLADATAVKPVGTNPRPRTIAVCRAGPDSIPPEFVRNLRAVFETGSRCTFLDSSAFLAVFGSTACLQSREATSWFNGLEGRYDYVFYLCDTDLTLWSEKSIRQADLVLSVGLHEAATHGSALAPNALEGFAHGLHARGNLRLVLLHRGRGAITGTRHWLDPRPQVSMHHHVELGATADYERLQRFIAGTALGLVACGGGAFCAAHVGLYHALREAGLEFDMMGGTSGGGAMTAAFASGWGTDAIDRGIDDIFVKSKALRRWTWPRYSLLDHTVLEQKLEQHYTGTDKRPPTTTARSCRSGWQSSQAALP
jgi:NTE family protein